MAILAISMGLGLLAFIWYAIHYDRMLAARSAEGKTGDEGQKSPQS